jgi:WD40 repeat protein
MNYSSYSDKIIKANEADNHEDTIQVIETDKNGKGIFVTGGWDGEVKVWQLNDTSTSSISNTKVDLKMKYSFNEMVLSLGLSNDSVLFIGLSNGELKYI